MKRQRGKFRDILTKEYLYEEHYVKRRTLKRIGMEVGCDHSTVAYYLHTNGLFVQPYVCEDRKNHCHAGWKGHGEISMTYWNNVRNGANQRQIPFAISIEDVWNLYLSQNKKCALSGREIAFEASKSNTASLDRIDPKKGYTIDNVQWVHRDVNFSKQSLTNGGFIALCREVATYNK